MQHLADTVVDMAFGIRSDGGTDELEFGLVQPFA